MSKKKISVLILVLLLVALVAFTFASCSKKQMELTATDAKAVYDGEVHEIDVSCSIGDVSGWTISYENDKGEVTDAPVNAGKYTATVTYTKKGYETATATATLTISKATPEVYMLSSSKSQSSRMIASVMMPFPFSARNAALSAICLIVPPVNS